MAVEQQVRSGSTLPEADVKHRARRAEREGSDGPIVGGGGRTDHRPTKDSTEETGGTAGLS